MDRFDVYTDPTARGDAMAGWGGNGTGKQHSKLVRLQRINTACRALTFVFTLAAVFAMFFASATNEGFKIKYTYFSSFQYFLFTNAVVAVYSLGMAIVSFIMGLKRTGQSAPDSMKTIVLIFNLLALVLLLLAFSAATATDVISRGGWKFTYGAYDSSYSYKVCDDYNKFCTLVEFALAFTGIAILSSVSGCTIDFYYNYSS